MSNVKGVIEQVKDDGGSKGKYGWQHRVSFKVDGEWYGGWIKESAEKKGLEEGVLVTFTYEENGQYKNYDAKSIKVAQSQGETPTKKQAATSTAGSGASKASSSTAGSGASKASSSTAGIKVGHAINNAVQLVASGKVPVDGTVLRTIHAQAVAIIALSVKLEGQFDAIVGKAAEVYEKNTTPPGNAPAETASEGKAASTTTAKDKAAAGKAKPAAKPKATPPPPPPAPEPEEEEQEEAQPEAPNAESDFDDDIPF